MRFGIYIHFPWCRNRCPYCDFPIAVPRAGEEPPHHEYLAAIERELAEQAPRFAGQTLVSIYFGGGTPSLWKPECIARLVELCCATFRAEPTSLEVSIECNPGDCEAERFERWQEAGISRVLLGVQATNADDLVILGRDHRMGDGLAGLERTLSAGFASVGADVILGVPGRGTSLSSLRDVANLSPPHISAYELTIEDRTTFGRRVRQGDLIPEDEDTLAALYEECHQTLVDRGYEHYEVSSYAKEGHRAVHNSLYWQGASYLGLGNGAASLLCLEDGSAQRWQNRRSVKSYLCSAPTEHAEFSEPVSAEDFAIERLWLAMRTSDGAPKAWFDGLESVRDDLERAGLLSRVGDFYAPTLKGFLYNNQLISRLGLASR